MAEFEKGAIHARVVFQVVGDPKEHVENSLKKYIENLRTDKRIRIIQEHFEPSVEKEKLWHTFAELDIVVKSIDVLVWIVINFGPASIEIVEPTNLSISNKKMTNWLMEIIAKLGEIGMLAKQIGSENKLLIKNMNRIIKNGILLCLSTGKQTIPDIHHSLGIDEAHTREFLAALIKEGKIIKDGDRFVKA